VSDAPELTVDRLTPANPTIHLRVPDEDLSQIRGLVPGRYVDLPEAMRALLRKGLTMELQGSVHG
jgi:Arc/MetJ-type ribon-helix-helix transcriptional regulator